MRCSMPRLSASRIAFPTLLRLIPARAAMASTHKVHAPALRTSKAMMLKAAISAVVKCAASWGGNAPEAAQRRRRSREACLSGERGRAGLRGALTGAACATATPAGERLKAALRACRGHHTIRSKSYGKDARREHASSFKYLLPLKLVLKEGSESKNSKKSVALAIFS